MGALGSTAITGNDSMKTMKADLSSPALIATSPRTSAASGGAPRADRSRSQAGSQCNSSQSGSRLWAIHVRSRRWRRPGCIPRNSAPSGRATPAWYKRLGADLPATYRFGDRQHARDIAAQPGLQIGVENLRLDQEFEEVLRYFDVLRALRNEAAGMQRLTRHRLAVIGQRQAHCLDIVIILLLLDNRELGRDCAVEIHDDLLPMEGGVVVVVVPVDRHDRAHQPAPPDWRLHGGLTTMFYDTTGPGVLHYVHPPMSPSLTVHKFEWCQTLTGDRL